MKILCVIDHFGSGGAQKQMVNLACALKARGHEVELFVYFPKYDFFRKAIDDHVIPVHEFNKGRGFSVRLLLSLAGLLWVGRYDAAISFLGTPNIYLELAGLFGRGTIIVASERSSRHGDNAWVSALARRAFHILADSVVANSVSHAKWLARYPWLRNKVRVIYNGYDIPEDVQLGLPNGESDLRLIAVGRIGPEKNCIALIRALDLFYSRYGFCPRVDWVGRRDTSPAGEQYWGLIGAAFDECPRVRPYWSWLGERTDVIPLICNHHALVHPALYEGLPNVVCEAMICGRPVLASDVCDHPVLVEDGERGYLFDPGDPKSIADAIHKMAVLGQDEWRRLGRNAREYGVSSLNIHRFAASYEQEIKNRLSRG